MFNIPYLARWTDGRSIECILIVPDVDHLDDSKHCDLTLDERMGRVAAHFNEGSEPFDCEISWRDIPGHKHLAQAGNVFAFYGYDAQPNGPFPSQEAAQAALDAHVAYVMEHGF